jgi:hypothetical protein
MRPGRDGIDAYVAALGTSLDAPRRRRARILAEVEVHLRESADAHGEEEALRRFGTLEVVAGRFQHELAAQAARRSLKTAAASLALLALLCGLRQESPLWATTRGPLEGVAGPVLVVLLEVCLGAGLVAWLRIRAAGRSGMELSPDGALGVARAARVSVAASVAGGLSVVAVSAARIVFYYAGWMRWLDLHDHGVGYPLDGVDMGVAWAILVGALAAIALGVGALLVSSAASRRCQAAGARGPGDAAVDLVRLAQGCRTFGLERSEAARALHALDPRRHPWRSAVAFAVVVGVVFAVGKGLSEHDAASTWEAATGAAQLACAQAGVILVAYASLGRYLGLRPARG